MNWYSGKDIESAPAADCAILKAGLNVALIKPEIAANAGNISRLCYASGTGLHIIGTPGFDIKTDKHFKRAAVDYWDKIDIKRHPDFEEFLKSVTDLPPGDKRHSEADKSGAIRAPEIILTSTNGRFLYFDFQYRPGDYIVFGPESSGIPAEIMERYGGRSVRIPLSSAVRSLNLSTACGIIVYHAISHIYRSSLT